MDVPHFEADSWTYVKGALATVDREFGFVGRHLFHGIIEYHVVHHLFPYVHQTPSICSRARPRFERLFVDLHFSRIPFYHAEEATFAIKPILGDLYHRDERSFMGQLWSNFTQCKYVEADESSPGALKWVQKTRD